MPRPLIGTAEWIDREASERRFREVQWRTPVVGRFPSKLSALTLVFVPLEEDGLKWRGLRMDDELPRTLKRLVCKPKRKTFL